MGILLYDVSSIWFWSKIVEYFSACLVHWSTSWKEKELSIALSVLDRRLWIYKHLLYFHSFSQKTVVQFNSVALFNCFWLSGPFLRGDEQQQAPNWSHLQFATQALGVTKWKVVKNTLCTLSAFSQEWVIIWSPPAVINLTLLLPS